MSHEHSAMTTASDRSARPRWVTLATEASHCGSGCTLGDVISEFVIFGLGLSIAGVALWSEYIGDYLLAVVCSGWHFNISQSHQCAVWASRTG